ncbi:MAG: class I SAM-dependent methyltransferase [Candidatus Portnoybacteria bacterium]|nr:class I SAM-dependent methyltransferase [Candidatus Portnoybacteria bacterium]
MELSKDYFQKDYYFGKKLSNYFNYNLWDNDRYWKSAIDTIKKYKISGRALDVGCAFGFFLKRIEKYFNEIHGIDISDYAIARTKEVAPFAKLQIVDISNDELKFPDKYFDLITAFDVLEHTRSIESSLGKLAAKLKDDGYLIISVPLRDTWAGRIFRWFDIDKSHISVPTQEELFGMIDRAGLKVIDGFYFLNIPYFKVRLILVSIEIVLRKQ